jgi:hypothetical protein
MRDVTRWDWESKVKTVADMKQWKNEFEAVYEPYVSHDGDTIASVVKIGEGEFNVSVNGATWEEPYEKIWYLRFAPDDRLTALVSKDMEWTMSVDGEAWEEGYEYIWDTKFSDDGTVITALTKQDDVYGITVNGQTWECVTPLKSIASHVISSNGKKVAAIAQTVPLAEGDIAGFMKGTWSVVVNGTPWDDNFVNLYGLSVSRDNKNVAAEYRSSITEYGILVNGTPWDKTFGCTWEPAFHPTRSDIVTAPVRQGGAWFLATNGTIAWDHGFTNLLYQTYSSEGQKIAATVATSLGKWTVAVDGSPWSTTFGECVLRPYFSPDNTRVIAIAKDNGHWLLVADGTVLGETFDNIWPPVFTPDGTDILCKVEKNGKYAIAINGQIRGNLYETLWDPILHPDGTKVLIRGIEGEKYYRRIVPLRDLRG